MIAACFQNSIIYKQISEIKANEVVMENKMNTLSMYGIRAELLKFGRHKTIK